MIVAFCGHRCISLNDEIGEKLHKYVEELINTGADTFYLGGYGGFDMLCAVTVKRLKKKYPHIKSILVIPYLNRDYDKDLYDYSIYPPIEFAPMRLAIIKRNEWIVDNCDLLISYVLCSAGGAARTLEYARRKKKKYINLFSD